MSDPSAAPSLIVSLDFELMWGMRDVRTKEGYGRNILGAREAIPHMLDAFEDAGIRATWATVGALFCEDREELLGSIPDERPTYADARLSSYAYLDEVGDNERADPYYYGYSLIRRIGQCPGQMLGTHTFSHYYCLEGGQTVGQFEADIRAALAVAARKGVRLESIVFPRNQYSDAYIRCCAELGISAYRGNGPSNLYRPVNSHEKKNRLRRKLVTADTFFNVSGDNLSRPGDGAHGCLDVPASRFLSPCAPRQSRLLPLKLSRIKRSMTRACRRGANYHLWWHPHNFGAHLEENMAMLREILAHYRMLRDEHGMRSCAMEDFVQRPQPAGGLALSGAADGDGR